MGGLRTASVKIILRPASVNIILRPASVKIILRPRVFILRTGAGKGHFRSL